MPNKYQVGTVGGIRKVINVKAAASTATTIQGLENTSISIAQLKTLLGNTVTVQPTNPGTPSAGAQSLTVSNGTTSVANVTVIDVPSGINVSAPGGNTAVLAIPLPLTVTDGTHNVTSVSNVLFQNSVNVSSTTAGSATIIMLPSLKVTDGSTLATSIGEIIFSGASVSTTSTNTSAVKVTITAGSLTVTDLSTVATSISELIFSGASVSTTSTNTTAAKITITGGGSGLTVTDGSTVATSISELIFSGASVSTTSTNTTGAKVTISGGGSTPIPGTTSDLLIWIKTDPIVATRNTPVLANYTPWITGPAASCASGGTNSGPAQGATLNGLATLNWAAASSARMSLAQPWNPDNITVFVVYKPNVSNSGVIIGSATGGFEMDIGVGALNLTKTFTAVLTTCSATWTTGTWYQANVTFDSSGNYSWRQARTAANSGNAGAPSFSAPVNGLFYNVQQGGSDMNASVAELIIYNRVLTGTEISNIENYLYAKWGV